MTPSAQPARPWVQTSALIISLIALMLFSAQVYRLPGKAKQLRRSGLILNQVVAAPADGPVTTLRPPPGGGFAPQTRLGYTTGDQWEPAIAIDRNNHVYILYPQYLGVPGCSDCYSPTMILQISSDGGATWGSPTQIYPGGRTTGQWDAQIVVDPIDGSTVYAAWLQNGKSDIAVAKSTDFGASWSVVIADHTNAGTDKPILVVRGPDVYVSYNHAQTEWVSSSHDGGATFTSVKVNAPSKLGWSLGGGGAIDPSGNVYFSWAGYKQNGGAKGPVYLYLSKSTNGGGSWTTRQIDASGAPPDCSAYSCGWAYLGAQITMAADSNGTLYALWNSNTTDKAPNRIYFAKSTDGGNSWTAKADVSLAPANTPHAFPAIAATGDGDVRISWMDARSPSGFWNTYYRSSSNSGSTWSAEADISSFVSGYSYITVDGFRYPFGDYYEIEIDQSGDAHVIMGEGFSYDSPGSIWYTRSK